MLRLDDPVETWLPELSNMRALRRIDGSLTEVDRVTRSILLRDLLTHKAGFALPGLCGGPLDDSLRAFNDSFLPSVGADEWMRRLGELPLAHQPGAQWNYGLSMDVLGVLISRVSGKSLGEFFRSNIFLPLGMVNTGFCVPENYQGRLATLYERSMAGGTLTEHLANKCTSPPVFESGGAGLVSTIEDYLSFATMLLSGGSGPKERLLSRKTVELMATNHLTPEQRRQTFLGTDYWAGQGFGFGLTIVDDITAHNRLCSVGQYVLGGAYGTHCFIDPSEQMIVLAMTQLVDAHRWLKLSDDVSTLAYQALDN
jgi:CubicO group peptidase (beta-lactamase class C family)